MLTPNEREWLTFQRERMVDASAQADECTLAIAALKRIPPWWRPVKMLRTVHRVEELSRQRMWWHEETGHRSRLINSWVAVHNVINGRERGPILPPSHDVGIRRRQQS